jgi:hypothetical protein
MLRPAEVRYFVAGSDCHQRHYLIVTKPASFQPWLIETAVIVNALNRLGAEQESTSEHMLTIDVTVIAGEPYVAPESGPKSRTTQAARSDLGTQLPGCGQKIPRTAVGPDPVRAKKSYVRMAGERFFRRRFETGSKHDSISIQTQHDSRPVPFEEPAVRLGYFYPQATLSTGSRWWWLDDYHIRRCAR